MKTVALGDNGVDYSCISRTLLNTITQKQPQIEEQCPKKPAILGGETNGTTITDRSVVSLWFTVQLHCGPLKLFTDFIVTDEEMNEVILGRPMLKVLGFELLDHLEANRAVLGHTDASTNLLNTLNNLPASGHGKLARSSLYTGLTYSTADNDPVAPIPTVSAAIGVDTPDEIKLRI